jgi:hypothetical protein
VIKDGLTQYQMVLFGGYMVDIRFGKTLFSLLCRVCRGSGTLFSMNITIARLIDDHRGIRENPAGRLITSPAGDRLRRDENGRKHGYPLTSVVLQTDW